jgi:hypothetical protein
MDVLSDEHSAFLNRHTGELVTLSSEELSAAEEDAPIFQAANHRYTSLP